MDKNTPTTRDTMAKEYFLSDTFLDQVRPIVHRNLVDQGEDYVTLTPGIRAKPQDLPSLREAFSKIKASYAELDHIRLASCGRITFDTHKNTFLRRLSCRMMDT